MINRESIIKVYDMAMLKMPDAHIDEVVHKFQVLYDFAAVIEEVDTEGLEPYEMSPEHECPLREDVVEPSMDREAVLANASEREFGYIKLKSVFKEEDNVTP